MSSAKNTEEDLMTFLLAQIAGIFSSGELSTVSILFAAGYVDHQRPEWIEFDGPEEFIAIVSSARRSLADLRVHASDVVRVGDVEAGVLHWAGTADDDTHVERRTVEILRLKDEHVEEHWGLELSRSVAATTPNDDLTVITTPDPQSNSDFGALLAALGERPNHRMVEAALRATGWTKVAAGDWAIALRSPDGTMAARISPFDPTGPYAAALYREATATGQVPILHAHRRLAGGGDLQIMEWLDPVPEHVAAAVHRAIAERAPEYEELVDTIQRIHERAKAELPWCGPLDDNPSNIMRASDGHLVVTDLFYADGPNLYATAAEDPDLVVARIPEHERRYLTEIPLAGSGGWQPGDQEAIRAGIDAAEVRAILASATRDAASALAAEGLGDLSGRLHGRSGPAALSARSRRMESR